MKNFKLITSLIIFLCCFNSINAQQNKLSLDINYPTPIGDNFIGKNYNGILDFGVKYNFLEISYFDIGVSGNFGLLSASIIDNHITVIMFKPRILAETNIWKFNPYLGIGYSFFKFYADTDAGVDKTHDGLNINVGIKYYVLSKIYINASYDFIKFGYEGRMLNSSYNRNVQILTFGLGIQL